MKTRQRQLPYLQRADLDDAARRVWDITVEHAGSWIVTPEGGLAGPFNAWLYAPAVGARLGALGGALLHDTVLDRQTAELAILTVAAHWRADFEWWAHAKAARRVGLPESVIESISRGEKPDLSDPMNTVHGCVVQLLSTGRLDDGQFEAAKSTLTERGLIELIAICGYYTLVAQMLNVFAVGLPAGERAPVWGAPAPISVD